MCVAGYDPAASLWLLSTGGGWVALRPGEEVGRAVSEGSAWEVEGRRVQAVGVPPRDVEPTQSPRQAMRIVLRYDHVHIHREFADPLVLGGQPAQLISELYAMGGSARWQDLAGQIWREAAPDHRQSDRYWSAVKRLRGKLRDAGIREDLLHSAGGGRVDLLIEPGDVVIDEG